MYKLPTESHLSSIFTMLLNFDQNKLEDNLSTLSVFFLGSICRIDAFLSSDQSRCASKLLSAYAEADIEEIKRVAQSSTISNLDHVVISS